MAAKFVSPYLLISLSPYRMADKLGENNSADAQVISAAVRHPHNTDCVSTGWELAGNAMSSRYLTKFYRIKIVIYNRLKGLVSQFSVIAPQSTDVLRYLIAGHKSFLPLQMWQYVDNFLEHIDRINHNITEYNRILSRIAKSDHHSQQLIKLKGIGPTTANAVVTSIGYVHDFKNRR